MVSLKSVLRILVLALLLGNAYATFFSRRGVQDWGRIKEENAVLSERLLQVKKEKESLQTKVAALKGDMREQEREVRQTLGYVRPGEVVIEFP